MGRGHLPRGLTRLRDSILSLSLSGFSAIIDHGMPLEVCASAWPSPVEQPRLGLPSRSLILWIRVLDHRVGSAI